MVKNCAAQRNTGGGPWPIKRNEKLELERLPLQVLAC
jgi:hypothetical protein